MAKRTRQKNRTDPLSRPVKPPSDPELAALRQERVLPVLRNLQAADPKERSEAAAAIANLLANDQLRRLFLRERLVHILRTQTLADVNLDSRTIAWEILRGLAEAEDAGFLVHLYRQDILEAIESAATKILQTIAPSHTSPSPRSKPSSKKQDASFEATASRGQQDILWRMATALCALLAGLAEADAAAANDIFQSRTCLFFLLTLVARDTSDPTAVTEALACLLILSEDSEPVARTLVEAQNAFHAVLRFFHADSTPQISVLAAGILHNVAAALDWNDERPGPEGLTDAALLRRLVPMLSAPAEGKDADLAITSLEIVASIATHVQSLFRADVDLDEDHEPEEGEEKEEQASDEEMEDDMDQDMKDVLDVDVDEPKKGKEPMEDDDHEDENDDEDDDDIHEDGDSDNDSDDLEDMALVTSVDHEDSEQHILQALPTLAVLFQAAVPVLLRLATAHESSPEKNSNVQHRALAALNNLAWSISSVDFAHGRNQGLWKAWNPVALSIWDAVVLVTLTQQAQLRATDELTTSIVRLAWAVSRSKPPLPTPSLEAVVPALLQLYTASRQVTTPDDASDPFASLGVLCIGLLGQLARDPTPKPIHRDIGVFLVRLVQQLPETPAPDAVEALHQLFDVYADDKHAACEQVFWEEDLAGKLQASVHGVQRMLRTIPRVRAKTATEAVDDERTSELRERAEEAALNLPRFLTYKKKHRPKQ